MSFLRYICRYQITRFPSEANLVGRFARRGAASIAALILAATGSAQDRIVFFDVDDPGVDKSIPTWGLDTAWLWDQNVIRGVEFMGKPQVDVIRFSFTGDRPLVDGDLEASRQEEFDERMRIVDTYTEADTELYFNSDSEGVDPYFKGTNGVNPERWAELLDLTRRKVEAAGRTVVSVAPFNEPDFASNGVGGATRLGEVAAILRNGPLYKDDWAGIRLSGGNTLNNDMAISFYSPNKDVLDEGATHQLAGSFDTYASFMTYVTEQGGWPSNDELHNVMEAMVGAEYGMKTGIWWGSAEYARGEFVKTSDGVRLGYAEHRPNWTAASVYRAPDGKVQAFVGESERQARPTSYLFVSKDRDVYFDGVGPQRAYTVRTTGGPGYQDEDLHKNAERVVNITWGEDIQPAIDGRYTVVNRQSGKVMEVEGGSSENGANIRQGDPSYGDHQSWLVDPVANTIGGDWSYFTMKPFHNNLKTGDVWNWNLDAGADIRLYDYGSGSNQQWILEYAGDGYFYIRSRFSGKYVEVADGSSDSGANIQMGDGPSGYHQHWRLLPAGALVELDAPASPAGLKATANEVSVKLSWDANGESDLNGYNVYRALSPEGPYDLVARSVAAASFVDKAANQTGPYYYRIKAVDQSLNRSEYSEQVMAAPKGGDALVTALEFEEDTSDSSGNDNSAVANDSASFLAGKTGSSALYFNGATSYATLPATVADYDRLTVACWVYWGGGSDGQAVFDFGNDTDSRFYLTPKATDGGLRFIIKDGDVEKQLDGSALATAEWKHVAVAIGDTNMQLYIDGALVDETAVSISPSDIQPILNYIGRSQSAADPFFKGRIDDFQIYNYALAQGEVASVAGVAAPPAPVDLAGEYNGSEVALSWKAVPGAASYKVKRSDSSDGPFAIVGEGLQDNSYSDADIAGGSSLYYEVTAVNEAGEGAASGALLVTLQTRGEQWRLLHFGSSENAGDAADSADPDGDLVPNALERAFGGDPKVAEQDLMPVVDDSVHLLSIIYRRSLLATDLGFTVEETSHIASPWTDADGESEVIDEEGDIQWIRFTRQIGEDDSLFLRLKVSGAE